MRVIDHRQFAHGRSGPQPRRWLRITLWSVAIVAALFVVLNGVMWAMYRNKVLPHYAVGAANVGGVAFTDVAARVTADSVLPSDIRLTADSTVVTAAPSELGIHPDIPATIKALRSSRPALPMLSLVVHHTVPVQVAVDDQTFTTRAISLQKAFAKAAVGTHVAYRDGAFVVADPEAGYTLNVTGLKAAVTTAAATGKATVDVPRTVVPAPAAAGDLQSEVQKLQKEVQTALTFVYGSKSRAPSGADMAGWYVSDGTTMALSRDRIKAYVDTAAKQLGVTPVNADEAVTASVYALTKEQKLTFRLVSSQGTTVYRYCVAERGLDDSVLPALKLKLAATYGDSRGWNDGGKIAFLYDEDGCQLRVWLAAPATMAGFGSICDDYYSCTVYPNVVINNDRWNGATDPWNAQHLSIEEYRAMAINHESGHWLGFGHSTCPVPGQPAPVMEQQSINLNGCTFNAWPDATELQTLLDTLHQTGLVESEDRQLVAAAPCSCGQCTGVGSRA